MIAIIGAMQLEIDHLLAKATQTHVTRRAGMDFHRCLIGGKELVIVRSGVGKVNAAICAQILVDEFSAALIINTGIAGAVSPQVGLGDIVLSQNAVQHDMDVRTLGYERGHIPQLDQWSFETDPQLLTLAADCAAAVSPDATIHTGRVLTGDQFVASSEKKAELHTVFGGLCAEMEGAAIAHTAYLNQVPFLIVRTISDNADNSAPMDYPKFEKAAAEQSARLVLKLIEHL